MDFDPEKSRAYLAALEDAERHRNFTLNWFTTNPKSRVLILRFSLECYRLWQEQHFRLCDSAQKKRSIIYDVSCLVSGTDADIMQAIPFCKLISGQLEMQCLERVYVLLNSSVLWSGVVCSQDSDLEHASYAFQLILGVGSGMIEIIGEIRESEPQRTLRVNVVPGAEEIIFDQCEHCHTAWSSKHCKQHLGSDATSDARQVGKAKRIQICLEADATIAALESLHAAARRRIKSRGIQTHCISVEELNSSWVMTRSRKKELSFAAWDHDAPDDVSECGSSLSSESDFEDAHAQARRGSGGGGLWRAFIRDASLMKPGISRLTDEDCQCNTPLRTFKQSSNECLVNIVH